MDPAESSGMIETKQNIPNKLKMFKKKKKKICDLTLMQCNSFEQTFSCLAKCCLNSL